MRKFFFFSAGASLLIISYALGYYFIYSLPKQKQDAIIYQQKIEAQKRQDAIDSQEKARESEVLRIKWRESCLLTASDNYTSIWNDHCKIYGLEKDCALPMTLSENLTEDFKNDKELCFKRTETKL